MKDHVTPNHFQELTTIYEVSKVLSSSMDLEHTLNDVLKTLESHPQIRALRGAVYCYCLTSSW